MKLQVFAVLLAVSVISDEAQADSDEFALGRTHKKSEKSKILFGGVTEQNPHEHKYTKLAKEALQKYMKTYDVIQYYKVRKVIHVTRQVVSGILTKIEFLIVPTLCKTNCDGKPSATECKVKHSAKHTKCNAEILDKVVRDINVTCSFKNHNFNKCKQKPLLVGMETEVEITPKIENLAKESLHEFLYNNHMKNYHKIVKINRAFEQLVAGLITTIEFKALPTNCRLNKKYKFHNSQCKTIASADPIECESRIWERAWLNKTETNVTCTLNGEIVRSKRQVPGGIVEGDPETPEAEKLAEESLNYYLATSHVPTLYKVVKVVEILDQVVAGRLTKMTFLVLPTKCMFNSKTLKQLNCEVLSSDDPIKCHSEIRQRHWQKKTTMKVHCPLGETSSRKKRNVKLGAPVEKDPTNPKFKTYAQESVQKYLQENEITQFYKVVTVERVTEQLVAGVLYKIDFTVKPTDCETNVVGEPTSDNCQIQHLADPMKCHSSILIVAWVNEKDYTVHCHREKIKDLTHKQKKNIQNKNKREITDVPIEIKTGALEPKDPDSPESLALAEESLDKYRDQNGIITPYKVLKVERVKEQLVAGMSYNITFIAAPKECSIDAEGNLSCHASADAIKCNSKIYKRTRLNIREINVNCAPIGKAPPGAPVLQDPDSPESIALAGESLDEYLKQNDIPTSYKVLKVAWVTKQVVAGWSYEIVFIAAPNECLINAEENLICNDAAHPSADTIKCNSKVWEKPWLNQTEINVNCTLNGEVQNYKRIKRQTLGAPELKDPDSPESLALAEESLDKYRDQNGIISPYKVLKVERVTEQLVAGMSYNIAFIAAPKECSIDAEGNLSCHASADAIKCNSKIYKKPWLNIREINVNCTPIGKAPPGAPVLQDPDSPESIALAGESLDEYLKQNDIPTSYKVLKVAWVTKQVVAGWSYEIVFIAAPNECLINAEGNLICNDAAHPSADTIKCNSKVWEKPWLNQTEINVNCTLNGEVQNYKRIKRQTLGAPELKDPDSPESLALAEESLDKYRDQNGIISPYKVLKVERVTEQLVAGMSYNIAFIAAPKECSIDAEGNLSCHASADAIKCNSKIYKKPWLNIREINVNCTPIGKAPPGAPVLQDPDSPESIALAGESLDEYLKQNDIPTSYKVLKVAWITEQVVEGWSYEIVFIAAPNECLINAEGNLICAHPPADTIKCNSKMLEKPWLNQTEINVNCTLNGEVQNNKRIKRQTLGAPELKDPDSPESIALVEESLDKYRDQNGIITPYKVLKVERVTEQLVAGTLYNIAFIAAPKECSIDAEGNLSCHASADAIKCNSKIYKKPWLNIREINVNCTPIGKAPPGAPVLQDPDSPESIALAGESLDEYLKQNDIPTSYKVLKVAWVTKQVVAGWSYEIVFIAAPNECLINAEGNLICNDAAHPSADTIKCNSKVWKKPWLNQTEINVNCTLNGEVQVKKLGAPELKDPDSPESLALAEESLDKYRDQNGIISPYKVLKVERVTEQLVAGMSYNIAFIAAPKECSIDAEGNLSCHASADAIKCNSKIYKKPWLNIREINVNCTPIGKAPPGAPVLQDPDSPESVALAGESLDEYLKQNDIPTSYKVLKVAWVTKQVVAGWSYEIVFIAAPNECLINAEGNLICNDAAHPSADTIKCNSKVWEKPWLNQTEINVNCTLNGEVQNNKRIKRQTLGAPELIDPDSPESIALVEESLDKYRDQNGIITPYKVLKVERVTEQLVAGMLYNIAFIAAPKECSIDAEGNLSCHASADAIKCNSKIYKKPWLNIREINVNCTPIDKASPGAPVLQDPDSPESIALAGESLDEYLKQNDIPTSYKVLKVAWVTKQVVAGWSYEIVFIAAPNECLINAEGNLICNDAAHPSADTIKCNSKVWEKPWLNQTEINVNCTLNGEVQVKKLGAPELKDPDSPESLALAEESLDKYRDQNGIISPYKVLKVERVTEQLVAGMSYNITFIAAPKECSIDAEGNLTCHASADAIKCNSKIYKRPWLNIREINVNCTPIGKAPPGAPVLQDPDSPESIALAGESLDEYLKQNDIPTSYKVLKVAWITEQVVEGWSYEIVFIAAPNECLINAEGNLICNNAAHPPADTIKCNSKMLEKPWLNQTEINVNCTLNGEVQNYKRIKRQTLGAPELKDPDSPESIALVEESLDKYRDQNGIITPYKVLKVERVTEQLVAGTLYNIAFIAAPKECSIDAEGNLSCHASADAIKCNSKIYKKPWLNIREINVNCTPICKAPPGAPVLQDPDSPESIALAGESLDEYLKQNDIPTSYKVLKVAWVTKQVVAGWSYEIVFIAAPNECLINAEGNLICNDAAHPSADTIKCNSKVWEKPWLNQTEINVNCTLNGEVQVKKLGAPELKDPDSPESLALAEESLDKYRDQNGIISPYKVLKVERVTEQLVAGMLYNIAFIAAPKECSIDAEGNLSCHASADAIKCNSKIYKRPWLNIREINVNCTPIGKAPPGAPVLQDPDSPESIALAGESLDEYLKQNDIPTSYKVLKVAWVTKQVVAGWSYEIVFIAAPNECLINAEGNLICNDAAHPSADTIKCNSKVWEKPWLNQTEINVNCTLNGEVQVKKLGAPELKDPDSPESLALAEESLDKYRDQNGIISPYKVLKVERVTEQLVAGMSYNITFIAAPKECSIDAEGNLSCHSSADAIKCNSKIYKRPWLNIREINVNCTPIGKAPPGAPVLQDPDSPESIALAGESLDEYLKQNDIPTSYKVLKVAWITEQVVEGWSYEIVFIAAPNECLINAEGNLICAHPPADTIKCNSKMLEKPWLNQTEINVNCTLNGEVQNNKRIKRQTLGAPELKDPDSPESIALVEESLDKYRDQNGIITPYKVLKVERVTEQLVAGTLYNIAFIAAPKECSIDAEGNLSCHASADAIKCNSKIYKKPWLNIREINVNCTPIGKAPPGAPVLQDPDSPESIALAGESLDEYLKQNDITTSYKVLKVAWVTKQVVAGWSYEIVFIAAPNECLINAEGNLICNDAAHPSADTIKCNSKVWEKPWLNQTEINVNCTLNGEVQVKKLGAPELKDPDSPESLALAEESLDKYRDQNGIISPYKVLKVERVTEQLVAGMSYNITFIAAPKECSIDAEGNLSCHASADAIKCNSKIYKRPWLNIREINVNCTPIGKAPPGAPVLQDPDSPESIALAGESLDEYLKQNDIPTSYKVLKVAWITEQVVEGWSYEIVFIAAPNGCLINAEGNLICAHPPADTIKCNSKMLEKPWLNQTEINVNCTLIMR